jgi:glycosyltransferase involved in cell wall biosynthesis
MLALQQRSKLLDVANTPEFESVASCQPTIALLPWGNVLEDFLDTVGISLKTFCNEFTGSWMFGYIDALRHVGVRTVLICISAQVAMPTRFKHAPTGATICLLPVPKIYRLLQKKMANPYGRTVEQMFGKISPGRSFLRPALAGLQEVALYLTTPLRLVAHELRRAGCKAILCQEYEYPRFDLCVLLGRVMKLPVFATFQGGDYQRSRLEHFFRPPALRACAGLIIAPQREARRVQVCYSLAPGKVAQIFNPIDTQLWIPMDRGKAREALGIPPNAGVVVWHGRVSIWQKGLDTLLEAWAQLCNQYQDREMHLLIVGTGHDSERLHGRIAAMQLRGIVWVDEFVTDRIAIRSYLAAGDVYAFSSRHEGFPVSVIEAMACGLPVVATEVQGVPDILEGGESSGGLMVPQKNAAALTHALSRVLDNQAWARELGRRARRRAEACFSQETVGRQLRDFLAQD